MRSVFPPRMRSVVLTVYGIQYAVYSILYTVYGIRYTVYSMQYTVYGIRYTVYTVCSLLHELKCFPFE